MKPFRLSIQVTPPQLLGEGVEKALDFLAAHGLDAIHLNTHTYYAIENRAAPVPDTWARDHRPQKLYDGVCGRAWVEHDRANFREIGLFHVGPDECDPTSGHDVYGEIIAAAEARGIAVHGRYLDGWSKVREDGIPGWAEVLAETLDGGTLPIPCFANPRVREWWRLTAGETAARYPKLRSLFYGIERGSTFNDVVYQGRPPYCFCEHCVARAREHGVDVARAKAGYRALHEFMRRVNAGESMRDGNQTVLYRILIQYPEILAWDRLERGGVEEMAQIGFQAVRAARPDCGYGQIAHQVMDPHRAAGEDWSLIRNHADYAVLRVYGHVNGPRLALGLERSAGRGVYGGLSIDTRLAMAWAVLHPEGAPVPSLDELKQAGEPPQLLGAALRRCHGAVGPDMPVYAGLGVDISYPFTERRETPATYIKTAVGSLKKETIAGVLICREYCEVSGASIRAINSEV